MRLIGYRYQRTLAAAAEVRGVGFITGSRVRARLLPAPPDTGVVFRRVDLPGGPAIPARADQVTGTQRRTTLGPPDRGVTLVEAYPCDKPKKSADDSMWFGAKPMFDRVGFVEVARRKPTRPVMRKSLRAARRVA